MSRLAGGILALLLAAAPGFAAPKKVVIVKSKALPVFDQAARGFRRCLPQAAFEEIVLPDGPQGDATAAGLAGSGAALIATVGVQASLAVREKAKGVPSVFCMVIDPAGSGLTKGGVSIDPKPGDHLEYLRKHFPQFKRVGVLYNPARSKPAAQALRAAAAPPQEVVLKEVADVSALDGALKALKAEADCLLMIVDSSIYNPQTASQLIFQTLQMNLPFIAVSAAFVKAGALAGAYADAEDNGCQAAEIAADVLKGEPLPPTQPPRKIASAVNVVVGNRLKVAIPASARAAAEEVLE